MSRDTTKITLEDQNKLNENIRQIEGVLELLLCALASEISFTSNDGVSRVIMDAQDKLREVHKAVELLLEV